MADEADKLERQMYTFCYDYGGAVEWYEKANEIQELEALTFQQLDTYFKELFKPQEEVASTAASSKQTKMSHGMY